MLEPDYFPFTYQDEHPNTASDYLPPSCREKELFEIKNIPIYEEILK
jgi:hypothetical protein